MSDFVIAPFVEDLRTGEKRREQHNEKEIKIMKEEMERLKKRIETLERKK